MSALVVGAGGFIGQHLKRALTVQGVRVIAASSQCANGLDPATGALRSDFSIPPGIDTVYYLAQSPRYRIRIKARTCLG